MSVVRIVPLQKKKRKKTFIILSTKFLGFDTEFLDLNENFIIFTHLVRLDLVPPPTHHTRATAHRWRLNLNLNLILKVIIKRYRRVAPFIPPYHPSALRHHTQSLSEKFRELKVASDCS